MPAFLDDDQLDAWRRDGVLVLPGFAATDALAALRRRADEIVDAFEPTPDETAVFSSRDRSRLSQRALAESAGQVRCFFEEEAFDAAGRIVVDKARAINKIGHALHDRDPLFSGFSRDPRLAALAADLGFIAPRLVQSMLIFKQPRIGGAVVWHQDASFLITEPRSVVGFWFALEDATIENGCLWAIPGDHKGGLRSRFVRDPQEVVKTIPLDPRPFPMDRLVPIEAPKGTLVVLSGLCPHMSYANTSPKSRHAYAVHVIDGEAAYPDDNWLRRAPDMPLRGFA
jgi:phytanoyl-CoA hydroxylase